MDIYLPRSVSPDVCAALNERLRFTAFVVELPNDPADIYALLRLVAYEGGTFYGLQMCADFSKVYALIELCAQARALLSKEFELIEAPGKSIYVLSSGTWWINTTGGPIWRAGNFSMPETEGFEFYEH